MHSIRASTILKMALDRDLFVSCTKGAHAVVCKDGGALIFEARPQQTNLPDSVHDLIQRKDLDKQHAKKHSVWNLWFLDSKC